MKDLSAHTSYVLSVAFSPDGKMLASGSQDKTVILWDVMTGSAIQTLAAHANSVTSVAFSPDGKALASGGAEGVVLLWNLPKGK